VTDDIVQKLRTKLDKLEAVRCENKAMQELLVLLRDYVDDNMKAKIDAALLRDEGHKS
jgi:hypothetical protein